MRVIDVDNVNQGFRVAAQSILEDDNWREIAPRDGAVTREYLEPVTTIYRKPWRRVLFNQVRDCNPFFHLMEALWMLKGRDDADWIGQFSSNIAQFAENDGKFHGAYGFRWRSPVDQIKTLVNHLRRHPESRRGVIAMWNPVLDLNADKRDIPCNTHIYFKERSGRLNMTVCNRSNDIIWGLYGANAVHFSVLQEYIAAAAGLEMGMYYHVSDSWHYYVDNPTVKKLMAGAAYGEADYYKSVGYSTNVVKPSKIVSKFVDQWDEDLARFFTDDWDDPIPYHDSFFRATAYPMRDAWRNYKRGDFDTALHLAKNIQSHDWSVACTEWLQRRRNHAAARAREASANS